MEFETAISSHTTEQVGYRQSGNIWSHPQPDTLLMENFFNDRRSKTLAPPGGETLARHLGRCPGVLSEVLRSKGWKEEATFQ